MPFTEKDLRAMLDDNSSSPPPSGDLAATAESRGRRVRRRRAAGGSVLAAAALVALGFAVVPSLSDGGAGRDVLASATAQSAASGSRPDVDLASLPQNMIPWAFFHGVGNIRAVDGPLPTPAEVTTEDGSIVYRGMNPLSAHSVVGTVEDFAPASDPSGRGGVHMKVRLGAQIDDPSRLEKRDLREGEVVTLWVGFVDDAKGDPSDALRRAVPKGTRVLAFERIVTPAASPADPDAPSVAEIRRVQSVVFEDADGSPVAGPYFRGTPGKEWERQKSFDALLELMRKAVYECITVALEDPVDEEALKDLSEKLRDDEPGGAKCLQVHKNDPSETPTPPPGVPVPTPAEPEDGPDPSEPPAGRPDPSEPPKPVPAEPEDGPDPSAPSEDRPAVPAPASPAS